MFREFLVLCLLLGLVQSSRAPTVRRVLVTTPYNASIVFEYANAAFPEGQPVTAEAIRCLTSQLTATGLFSDIQVTLNTIDGGNKVDVDILPLWNDSKDSFLVKEISIDGFTALDETQLIRKLRQKGLRAGVPLLRYPLPTIREMLLDSVREIYQSDSKRMYDAEEDLSELSFRLDLVAPQSVKLRFTKASKLVCQ